MLKFFKGKKYSSVRLKGDFNDLEQTMEFKFNLKIDHLNGDRIFFNKL